MKRDMFEMQAKCTGSVDQDCQVKSVPHSLLALVNMIHNDPSFTLPVSHKMVTLMIFFDMKTKHILLFYLTLANCDRETS